MPACDIACSLNCIRLIGQVSVFQIVADAQADADGCFTSNEINGLQKRTENSQYAVLSIASGNNSGVMQRPGCDAVIDGLDDSRLQELEITTVAFSPQFRLKHNKLWPDCLTPRLHRLRMASLKAIVTY